MESISTRGVWCWVSFGAARLLVVTVLLVTLVGAALPAAASEGRDTQREVFNLVRQNHLAQQIANLNLTPGQVEEFKSALQTWKEGREVTQAQLVELLQERLDAVVSGDGEAVKSVDQRMRRVARQARKDAEEALRPFLSGLTERQIQIVRGLLGGGFVGGHADRHVRRGPEPMSPPMRVMIRPMERDSHDDRERAPWADRRDDLRMQVQQRIQRGPHGGAWGAGAWALPMTLAKTGNLDMIIDLLDRFSE